jgi:glucosamine--fructose-6-phosphate aminotransferase (isomerizing)
LPAYDRQGESVDTTRLLAVLPVAPELDAARDPAHLHASLSRLVDSLAAAVALYANPSAAHLLTADGRARARARSAITTLERRLTDLDSSLDQAGAAWDADAVEAIQGLARTARDHVWSLRQDRLAAADRVRGLIGARTVSATTSLGYFALDTVLDAIDRLEVRGRDSAGVHAWIQLDPPDMERIPASVSERADPLFRNCAVQVLAGGVSLVYKSAAIIGRLGDNVRSIRTAIAADAALHDLLALPSARLSLVAHTRWASVGRISEANAHPVNSVGSAGTGTNLGGPYVIAVLNGDIDNHLELRESEKIETERMGITTDAKLIPVMLASRLGQGTGQGASLAEAMSGCLRAYDGSMAIASQAEQLPDQLVLAVRGSGQGLYVGLAPGCFLVASEVYGLVAATSRYLRLDGRSWGEAGNSGTVVVLDRAAAGTLDGLRRYDGTGRPQPVRVEEIRTAEVTTRDIALGGFEHYLEKEIAEAPASFRKTLRGRVRSDGDQLFVDLPTSSLPEAVRKRFKDGSITELVLVGQGTAAVACQGIAGAMSAVVPPQLSVRAAPATELSAWGLQRDMSHVCLVAVSQSGTTTDTNRTVDLARERGAAVLAIVNRRESDLAEKSDGVLYTSDGRDVEMAVASTKAFYAQVAAGALLGLQIARIVDSLPPAVEDTLLRALGELPEQLRQLQARKTVIMELARRVAPRYPYWAVVGSGANRVAAAETRIKLSELCYKTISTDAVEDKKHIDLAAEALIVVCAAGAPPGQVRDLMKEVEIFTAHRNVAVVIADEDLDLAWATELVIRVPKAHPSFSWILSTAAGHLFAYFAARAIDESASELREALADLEAIVDDSGRTRANGLDSVGAALGRFVERARRGDVRGALPSDAALDLAAAAWYLQGNLPVDVLAWAFRDGLRDPVDYLRASITSAVDELTRSVDTVKHQAKTVTVGTSRSDADLYDNDLVQALSAAGGDTDSLSYSVLLALRAYAGVTDRVLGTTRYRVMWDRDRADIQVTAKTGIAAELPSRADTGTHLSGSKKLVVESGAARLVRGRRDQRLVLMVPERSGSRVTALILLHVSLRKHAPATRLADLLQLTGGRLAEIRAAVTEVDRSFEVADLAKLPVEQALLAPVDEVAEMIAAAS